MTRCIQICERLGDKIHSKGFNQNKKWCNHCEHYFEPAQSRCPCCNQQLRNKARNSRTRKKINKQYNY